MKVMNMKGFEMGAAGWKSAVNELEICGWESSMNEMGIRDGKRTRRFAKRALNTEGKGCVGGCGFGGARALGSMVGGAMVGGMKALGVDAVEVKVVGCVERGWNVVRDEWEKGVWRPAGVPAVVREDGWVPWRRVGLKGCRRTGCVLWLSGNAIGVSFADELVDDVLAGVVTEVGMLPGVPLEAIVVEAGVIRLLMKWGRSVYVVYDADGVMSVAGCMPSLPGMRIEAVGRVRLSESIGDVALSGSGVREGALPVGDVERLSKAFGGAYGRLLSRASRGGYFVQPVVARWRLMDARGDTVVCGPPVLLSAGNGMQCTGEVMLRGDSSVSVASGGVLTAEGFTLEVSALGSLPAPWSRIVSRAVVEVSEQIDPVDREGDVAVRVVNNGGSQTNLYLTAAGSAVRDEGSRGDMVTDLLRRGGRLRRAGEMTYPFEAGSGTLKITTASGSGAWVDADWGMTPDRELVSHGVGMVSGDLLIRGNRREEVYDGHRIEWQSCGSEAGSWQGTATVTLRRGGGIEERVMVTGYGVDNVPSEVGPLLSYPDADATTIELHIRGADGRLRRERMNLTSLPEAGMSVWVANDLKGHKLPETAAELQIGGSMAAVKVDEGVVETSPAGCPGEILGSAEVMKGAVRAVAESPRGNSSWEFSRRRVTVGGDDGMKQLVIDKDGRIHSMATLDRRGISEEETVTESTGEKGMTLTAVSGGECLEAGRSGVSRIGYRKGAFSAAYESHSGALWTLGKGGEVWMFNREGEWLRRGGEWSDREDMRLLGWEGRLLIKSGEKLLDCGREEFPEEGVDCRLSRRMELPSDMAFRCGDMLVEIEMESRYAEGTLTLSGDDGDGDGEMIMRLEVAGRVPDRLAFMAEWCGRRFLTLAWHGRLTKDSRMRGVRIKKR